MQKAGKNKFVESVKVFFAQQYKKTVKATTVVLVVLLVGIASFVCGTRSASITAWLKGSQNASAPQALDFSSLQQVYDQLRTEYDGKVDAQKLIDGAKKGLVSATGDPYTVYFTDEEAKQFNDDLEGKFSGIGAEIGTKNNDLIISSTLDDSPAKKAGLLRDDILAQVNGEDVADWSIDQAVSKIRGEKGTTVKLKVVRNQELKEISIVRDDIINPSVKYEILEGNIGYLRISRFADDTTNLAQKAADEFVSKGVKGAILDLRGDGGGYLTAAQNVAGLWLESGKEIVQERTGSTVQETLKAQGSARLKGIKTVVLIDGGSASASEIVAGALSDHKAATLIGTKTYGKGSVQQLVELPLGGQLKVTIAKWYTPSGKNIDKEGISPDTEVKQTDADTAAGNDSQKNKAIETINN